MKFGVAEPVVRLVYLPWAPRGTERLIAHRDRMLRMQSVCGARAYLFSTANGPPCSPFFNVAHRLSHAEMLLSGVSLYHVR
jgi:hypothetical protein